MLDKDFHPKAQMKLITVREAFEGLSENIQDESIGHCWPVIKPDNKTYKALLQTRQGEKLKGFTVAKRLSYKQVAGTIQTGAGYVPGYPCSSWPAHPTAHRGISVREAARLASFPDSFSFGKDWRDGCKRIGNSVPPKFMQAIAEHVYETFLAPMKEREG